MSKAHDPHWRYVAFGLRAPKAISRRAMANSISGHAKKAGWDEKPQLTRYAFPYGIVKVPHHRLADARELLPRITWAIDDTKVPITVKTLLASGTIKTLTDRLGILKENRRR